MYVVRRVVWTSRGDSGAGMSHSAHEDKDKDKVREFVL